MDKNPYVALLQGRISSVVSYRASFAVEVAANVGSTAFDIVTVLVLFSTADRIGGFSLAEAVLMIGLAQGGFVLADFSVGTIDNLKTYVRTGALDAMLVRPLAVLPQLVLADMPLRKALRVVLGLTTLGVAAAINDIDWTPARVLLLLLAPMAGAVFFGAIFVLSASLAFWWVESGEVGSGFTYGGRDFTSYPVTVYGSWFRNLFAYGLGFAFVSYQPALALLGRADPLGLPAWAGFVSPLVALLAAALAAVVWRTGVRHYRSTGS